MPQYKYTASDIGGALVKSRMDAGDASQLREALRIKNLYLIDYEETTDIKTIKKLKANEIADFCRQIGSMLVSGITLVNAMSIILQRDLKPKEKQLYATLNQSVKRGIPLSDSMASLGKAFPELLINMFRAGESSGKQDEISMKMAEHYEKEHKLNSTIKGAMMYPIILAVLMVVAIVIIFAVILPNFFTLFSGMELPLPTRIVIAISNVLTKKWYIVIIVVLMIAAIVQILGSIEPIRLEMDKMKLKAPIIGKLMKVVYTSRFCRTLSSLYSSGLSIISALQIARTTIGNRYIAKQFEEATRKIRQGVPMSAALSTIDGFDKKLFSTVLIGEESGRLEEMLISTADSFDYESEIAIRKLTGLIEPIMLVFMGLMIGFIFVAVMMPIFQLYQNISM